MRNQDMWTPKFPEAALNYEGAVGDAIQDPTTQTGGGSVPWTEAPADSHLWGFRFHDARDSSFLRKFRGNVSILSVRFKPPANNPGKGISEYEYEFTDPATGAAVFAAMAGHPDPGELVHSELIRKGVPYRKTQG